MKSILILLFILPIMTFAQDNVTWDYPIKPGAETWKLLKNNAEKVQACQVPTEKLTAMSTQELIHLCLNYPLLLDIFAFNYIKDGFGKFESDFNGYRELIKRDNAAEELLKLYKNMDPTSIPKDGSILEKGDYVFKFSFIELFISYPMVVEKCSTNEKMEIVNELLLKKEKKKSRPDWYENTGIRTNYLAIVNILQSDTEKFQSGLNIAQVTPYIYWGILPTPEIIDQIDQEANQYVKNN
ncbi:MAG TPA: hypothetical protein VEP89_07185 [Draconibacterium sp.]|nr:hypothetical protein [Draconibacterium sp.]